MVPPFDIFRVEQTGQLVWQGTAETLELVTLRIKTLMASLPSDYVIYSEKTGYKTVVSINADSIDTSGV